MKEKLEKFREIVKTNNARPDFVYRDWMFEHHLEIVHRIAMELCDIYTDADRDIVEALVWFHDFGKPLDEENERPVTRTQGPKVMSECGFAEDFIAKVLEYWELMEKKNEIDIRTTPLEVQIISTADGCSHFVGMFYPSFFGDGDSLDVTREHLSKKIEVDWNRKIVLPEAREAFQDRYERAKELIGQYPQTFI